MGVRRGAHKALSKKTRKKPPAKVQKAKLKIAKREAAKVQSSGHLSRGKFEKEEVQSVASNATGPAIVLAHGAGSSSTHAALKAWRSRLTPVAGKVYAFDYPRPFYRMAQLAAAHAAAVSQAYEDGFREIVLVGCGMGARVAVHLLGATPGEDGEAIAPLEPSLRACVKAQVALGYPLTRVGSADVRDAPLRALPAEAPPLLFVSGTNDAQAPLEALERARAACALPTTLCVAEGADGALQSRVDTEARMASVVAAVGAFVSAHTEGLGRHGEKKLKKKKKRSPEAEPAAEQTQGSSETAALEAADARSQLAAVEDASRLALAAAGAAPFVPAKAFGGLRDGFTFAANGPQGSGYYQDRLSAAEGEGEAGAGAGGRSARRVLFNGVEVLDTLAGKGAAATPGQYVSVRYAGNLVSGKRFDAGTIGFKLGAGKVIKGWDTGVAGMRVGGKRKLVVPARAAYGKRGSMPTIPPNATLRFEVELLRIK